MMKFILQLNVLFFSVNSIEGYIPHSTRWKRQTCSLTQYSCDSGGCIDKFYLCDGEINCSDRSDETKTACQNIRCPSFSYRCDYGACVDLDAKCNGIADCADKSDEKDCFQVSLDSCKGNQYKCKSGKCIDQFLICDGTKDCDDGSDETLEVCRAFRCPEFSFRCDYGACIEEDGRCNGIIQCADESDEKPDTCGINIGTKNPTKLPQESEGCILPPQPQNGNYKLAGCDSPCIPQPGTVVRSTFISYTCKSDFTLLGSQNVLCQNGWSSPFPNCSRVSCEPLINPSRDIKCTLHGKKVKCDKPMIPRTIANLQCKTFYSHSHEFAHYEMICRPDGKWNREITSCQPQCGEPNPVGLALISHGFEAKLGEFPWHAGIYIVDDGAIIQACGGSIVSVYIIVTAAHCFWDDNSSKQSDIKDYRVVVGKYFFEWNKTTDYVQHLEIDKVIIHDRYRGLKGLYQSDIALIFLKTPIVITIAVRPICLDNDKLYLQQFTPGIDGVVTGWGYTETQQQRETLHAAHLPYVSFSTCVDAVPENFISYLQYDKFCAGHTNGTSVCPGDSGGGFATQFKDKKWYLMGIVSVGVPSDKGDRCNIQHYTTFTSVMFHFEFLKDHLHSFS